MGTKGSARLSLMPEELKVLFYEDGSNRFFCDCEPSLSPSLPLPTFLPVSLPLPTYARLPLLPLSPFFLSACSPPSLLSLGIFPIISSYLLLLLLSFLLMLLLYLLLSSSCFSSCNYSPFSTTSFSVAFVSSNS